MNSLHPVDITILLGYLLAVAASGVYLARFASKNLDSYFLGGRDIPWYALGISNASGMFDAAGTMAMVAWMFVYGVKSLWIPWLWPTFNQVVMMVFLAAFLRRSGAITGADWLRTRFGQGKGFELAHLSVVAFALVSVVAFIAYAFVGVGKFATLILPWDYSANTYATVLVAITTLYAVLGGMHSVVLTDVIQFLLLTIASIAVGVIAITQTSPEAIAAATPEGWDSLAFGWNLDLDWGGLVDGANQVIADDIYRFMAPFVLMAFFNGMVKSIAGPTPGYDMQRVLAAKNEREASLMSGIVSPVLFVPRYLLITGMAVLALVHFSQQIPLNDAGKPDFEQVLPLVITGFIPVGVTGLLLAGLFAAFMSTFDSNLNSGAAYLVNDLYRRYFRPQAGQRELTIASYAACLLVVGLGVMLGLRAGSINESVQWIAGALFGGYAAPNVMKWVWWRLNASGYLAGMATGVVLALLLSKASLTYLSSTGFGQTFHLPEEVTLFQQVPILLFTSALASILASLLTPPDDRAVLCEFYRRVRPWGFWGPIRDDVVAEHPGFQSNQDFTRDMITCMVGIVWQMTLCLIPLYLVLQRWPAALATAAGALLTSWVLKVRWYDRLPAAD